MVKQGVMTYVIGEGSKPLRAGAGETVAIPAGAQLCVCVVMTLVVFTVAI